ncbi:unnamed protein product [Ceutorhynchus assimilis]|uniref:Uncharacterized protein n=1 Tax=Ceutorhynchus assimilis TaxID=467358 RepID=A0A9N9QS64_9CUCU|nr:unnamed protein product [Ceutorhynchus assimilis]
MSKNTLKKPQRKLIRYFGSVKIDVKRCEELRKANIKKFVDKLRDQLQTIWTTGHCSDADKKTFRYFYDDFYTEDLLDLHELEIQKWKKYYEDNGKLLDIIKKHQELCMIQFEENATGVNRFKNRGGQLLQEEKERNKLSKVIPQLEEQMLNLSGAFLVKNGVVFKTFGSTVEEYIQNLHESRENDRKTKLSARKLQRCETTLRTPGKSCMSLFPPSTSKCTTVSSYPKNDCVRFQKEDICHAYYGEYCKEA